MINYHVKYLFLLKKIVTTTKINIRGEDIYSLYEKIKNYFIGNLINRDKPAHCTKQDPFYIHKCSSLYYCSLYEIYYPRKLISALFIVTYKESFLI